MCFQDLLDCSLAALCGSFPTGRVGAAAQGRTSGNVIALSWEERAAGWNCCSVLADVISLL